MNLTKLYKEERTLRLEESSILRHFGGYRNQKGNVLPIPAEVTSTDAEHLERYGCIQQKLESVHIAIEKAKEKEIEHILATGTPENPYDVLRVLHARFDYRGKSPNELETIKQEARRLFATFDESVDYTQYKY